MHRWNDFILYENDLFLCGKILTSIKEEQIIEDLKLIDNIENSKYKDKVCQENLFIKATTLSSNIDFLKFLISKGLDVHLMGDKIISNILQGNYPKVDILKFLISKGLNGRVDDDIMLKKALNTVNNELIKLALQIGCDWKKISEYPVYRYKQRYLEKYGPLYSTLGPNYDYTSTKIGNKEYDNDIYWYEDALKINPSLWDTITDQYTKNKLEKRGFKHLAKSDEYGLFENINQEIEIKKKVLERNKFFLKKMVPLGWSVNDIVLKSSSSLTTTANLKNRKANYTFDYDKLLNGELLVYHVYNQHMEDLPSLPKEWKSVNEIELNRSTNLNNMPSIIYKNLTISDSNIINLKSNLKKTAILELKNCNKIESLENGPIIVKSLKITNCKKLKYIPKNLFLKSVSVKINIEDTNISDLSWVPEECNDVKITFCNIRDHLETLTLKKVATLDISRNDILSLKGCPEECYKLILDRNVNLKNLKYGPIKCDIIMAVGVRLPEWYFKICIDLMKEGKFTPENHDIFIIDAIKNNPKLIDDMELLELSEEINNGIQHILKSDEYGLFENKNQEELNRQLIDLVEDGNLDEIKFLISQGADINAKDNDENTPLMFASKWGYLNICNYLIKHGANINFKNNGGFNALTLAQRSGNLQVIKYLKSDAYIDNTLGPKYDYNKDRKQQIIDAIKINPSIIEHLNKEELSTIPEIQSLLKSDEYGLFEKKIMNFNKYIKIK